MLHISYLNQENPFGLILFILGVDGLASNPNIPSLLLLPLINLLIAFAQLRFFQTKIIFCREIPCNSFHCASNTLLSIFSTHIPRNKICNFCVTCSFRQMLWSSSILVTLSFRPTPYWNKFEASKYKPLPIIITS